MFSAAIPAIPAIAALIGGASSAYGVSASNSSNAKLAREANDFSAKQAQLNRDFQDRESSTSWQRGVADMKAAGINPMLAVSQGGASSPSGNSAQGIANANQQNEFASFQQAAKDALLTKAQVDNLNANSANAIAQADKTNAGSAKDKAIAPLWKGVQGLVEGVVHSAKNGSIMGDIQNWTRREGARTKNRK